MRTHLLMVVAVVALLASAVGAYEKAIKAKGGLGKFEFALIGDVPYNVSPGQRFPQLDRLVARINRDRRVKFTMHVGDIKAGATECSDALYLDRLDRFNAFRRPFILTLGDNDWADCWSSAPPALPYRPHERLDRLRRIFFSIPGVTLGRRPMRVESQAETAGFEKFRENVRWMYHRVLFATVHLVGDENGREIPSEWLDDPGEVDARDQANLAWLRGSFERAEKRRARAILIMMHAKAGLEKVHEPRPAYSNFLATLETLAVAYGKPVVLAHGDSHYFRIDKPKLSAISFLPNFTRVEPFGNPRVHWVRVLVNPRSKGVFTFAQEIVEGNL